MMRLVVAYMHIKVVHAVAGIGIGGSIGLSMVFA
jgi:hypothetical protein